MVDPLNFDAVPAPRPPAPSPSPVPPAPSLGQDEDPRIQAALDHVRSLLVAGEQLLAYTVQRRLFALAHRRVLVAATTGRLIRIVRPLLGGFQPTDVRWQDLQEVSTRAGIFGADLTVRAAPHPDLASTQAGSLAYAFTGMRKVSTAQVYRIAQGQEQSWREKRRTRELEETRARSGGIQLGGGAFSNPAASISSLADRLAQAKAMLDQHLISDAEYEATKARIIGEL